MPDVPELIAAGELEIKDITGEIRQDSNFAIMHRGGVIRDGFATQAAPARRGEKPQRPDGRGL
jgi:hypothetical protein